jgi:hypothetical protein
LPALVQSSSSTTPSPFVQKNSEAALQRRLQYDHDVFGDVDDWRSLLAIRRGSANKKKTAQHRYWAVIADPLSFLPDRSGR